MLSAAVVRAVEGTTLVISHDTAPLVARLSDARASSAVGAAMGEIFGGEWSMRCVHMPADASPAGPQAARGAGRPAKAAAPTYTRRGRSGGAAPSSTDDEPPPEEPAPEPPPPVADEDLSEAERDEMIADARGSDPDPHHDPDQVALELLASELGARRID